MIQRYLYNEEGELRPTIARALRCAIVFAVGYFVYSAWAGSGDQLATNLMCATPGCGYVDSRTLKVGDQVPAICPRCDKRSVYQSLKCVKCAKPLLFNELKGLTGPTRCGSCGTEMSHER